MRRVSTLVASRAAASTSTYAVCSRAVVRGNARSFASQSEAASLLHPTGVQKFKFFHYSSYALGILVPLAVFSPANLVHPIDLILGVLLPVHGHVGMVNVIEDYVPKNVRGVARWGLWGVTAVTIAGLTKLNLTGSGITGSVKQLWRKEPLTTTAKETSTA